ncbi:MAG: hypothetical protein ABIO43_03410 [Sphingomicrobium sp.]
MAALSSEQTGIVATSLEQGSEAARNLLDKPSVEALELARPPLDELPYRDLVRALLGCQGFKLDFRGQKPAAVLAMVTEQLVGPGAFLRERALLAEEIAALETFATGLVGAERAQTSIRTYFAPGDLVWHVDRVNERNAFRLVWPIGRPAGMYVTPATNIDPQMHLAFMRREHPLLCQLDTRVLNAGVDVERLWAHRPAQLAAMTSGRFPFLRDPRHEWQVQPNAISIHRVETPAQRGTYHRSSWANRSAPGLQIVITVAAD